MRTLAMWRRAAVLTFAATTLSVCYTNCSGGFVPLSETSARFDSSQLFEGKALYDAHCLGCHGVIDQSTKRERSTAQIAAAIQSVPQMQSIVLSARDLQLIAGALSQPQPSGLAARFSCTDPSTRGTSSRELRRLSYREFRNSLTDLVGASVVAQVASFNRFPPDNFQQSIEQFTKLHTLQHVDAILAISMEAAQALVANRTALDAVAPGCIGSGLDASSIPDACLRQFVAQFGRRALRRPPTSTQIQSYVDVYNTNDAALSGLTVRDRLELVIARVLEAPDFHFHWETSPSPGGTRSRVDAYTVASRLSFKLTGSIPDETLLNAAASGGLDTLDGVRAQAQRLLATPAARRQFRDMVNFWLKLDAVASPHPAPTSRLGIASDGASRLRIRDEVVRETLDFSEHLVFDKNGSFDDLMTSNLSFPRSADMAKILNVTYSGGTQPIATTNGRRGLLTRPAILLSNLERERIIHRGAVVRTRFLCDLIPPPPANVDQIAADNVATLDVLTTSAREIAHATTKTGSCQSCHSQFNPLGYVLSGFGQLGEKISVERVYNPMTGAQTAELPVDARGTGLNIVDPSDVARDEQDMIDLVRASGRARACLPQMMFRWSHVREEESVDMCALSEAETVVRANGPVKDALLSLVASDDIFWRGN